MSSRKRGKKRFPQPNIWIALSVFLLIFLLITIKILGPSSVTGNTIQPIGYMTKGEPLHLAVKDVPGLELVFTNAAETIKNGKIVVEVDGLIPFDRPYVTKFSVSSEQKFGPLRFTFKVKEQDLYGLGIGLYDLRVYDYKDNEYPTQLLKQNYGYIYYIANVPDMGRFVLGKVAPVEATAPEPSPEISEPEAQPEETVEVPTEEPLVGKAAEIPAQEKSGLWARIASFFRNLFS
ncbi:MAG TPA: hypothetical protein VJA18_01085 [Candidatus Nanoarchaeia archaeon]|nr:hypothetical protein [Candidatus Nanoarchaeia archaeon]